MNNIEVLISTMKRTDYKFIKDMNISTDILVVNQNGLNDQFEIVSNSKKIRVFCSEEVGLSKSRNLAIKNSAADICVIADDDMVYIDNFDEIILRAHNQYEEADIIAFQVKRFGGERLKTFHEKPRWLNYLTSLKVSSVEITFKKDSIVNNGIKFNELMGSGSEFYLGEENIFMYDCLKKGLRILYLPINVASVDVSESSWFEGYTKKYFNSLGAAFYNMSTKFYPLLIIQAVIRKYKIYSENSSLSEIIREMFEGVRMYRNKEIELNVGDIKDVE